MGGEMYYMGQGGLPEDKAKASYWFMDAAKKGVPHGMYTVGTMLIKGDGVEKDEAYGVRLLSEAANKDHTEAMGDLGEILYEGWHGVDRDRGASAIWMDRASQKGHLRSMELL